ncbi:GlxA family transcriptional regulator [Rhizobium sp. LEGMi198b]|uniref:GlxA family transcriptional regulator n=1 Tax=unclassified Rhizobium TaxID=2613769 RepID=UPI000CDF37BD|nr:MULTISPECIES: GlxA family transcriptional regulator [Rhizobium]AVA24514.1 transcriptional regulator GlxA [Rhizobium sp. NXC24]MDK4742178.1 GlxA family transcriptional regulator [Rhizobium sp. CNPSo 3464]UWU24432.1 GlxA family transcriptional regulator [Rhizobium tropici]WFU05408.1 GlxA family transcriptional regulator [Rhizobium sp. CB3171]
MRDNSSSSTQRYGFALTPNFALMSYASATEPLRAANLIAQTGLYEVIPLSVDGRAVASSSGFAIPCEDISVIGASCHTIFVVAGGNPGDWKDAAGLHPVLRRLARQGVRIGGISSGSYLLAAAGLMDGRDFTIHWEHAPAMREAFPHLSPRQARYVLDGDRITCGGGVAPLDMMHALIEGRLGTAFARRVSDWYLHTAVAEPTAPQRGSSSERFGTHHPALITVLEKMEATIEQPMDRRTMAKLVGLSPRHLDRLFAEQLGVSFHDSYHRIRLDHARRLLEQSPLSISELAFATGFSSASHFSRAFRQHFGLTPKSARAIRRTP